MLSDTRLGLFSLYPGIPLKRLLETNGHESPGGSYPEQHWNTDLGKEEREASANTLSRMFTWPPSLSSYV